MTPSRTAIAAGGLLAALAAAAPLRAQTALPDFSGTWQGQLTNVPRDPAARVVDVTMEIGPMPAADSTCTLWRTTYAEGPVVKQVKDYRLCRGSGGDWYVDEGDGTRLPGRWVGNILVVAFRAEGNLLVATIRLSGVWFDEEIVAMQERPDGRGASSLVPRGVQRYVLRRRPL